jgi:hypothetical protein
MNTKFRISMQNGRKIWFGISRSLSTRLSIGNVSLRDTARRKLDMKKKKTNATGSGATGSGMTERV